MVKWLIASLIAGVAIWLYLRSRNAGASPLSSEMSDSDIAASTPDGGTYTLSNGRTYQKIGGISFDTGADATADPAAAQRRLDALNRAATLEAQAAAQGKTVDQTYQDHLAQSLADQQKETQVIMDVGTARANAAASAAAAGAAAAAASANANAFYSGASMPILTPPPPVTPLYAPGTSKSTAEYVTAVLNSGPSGPPPSPGMTWDYAKQQWVWALF